MTRTRMTVLAAMLGASGSALGNPVQGVYTDLPGCDDHGDRFAIEELGEAPLFPADELIDAVSTFTDMRPCPTMWQGGPSALVIMTNLTDRDWDNLWYVADRETTLSNVDGVASSFAAPDFAGLAFRIDAIGMNRPLIAESMTADGIFESGETWEFLIQDYGNLLGISAGDLGSLDFAGASSGAAGLGLSSGSIVQFVPAPGAVGLLLFGAGLAGRRRR